MAKYLKSINGWYKKDNKIEQENKKIEKDETINNLVEHKTKEQEESIIEPVVN